MTSRYVAVALEAREARDAEGDGHHRGSSIGSGAPVGEPARDERVLEGEIVVALGWRAWPRRLSGCREPSASRPDDRSIHPVVAALLTGCEWIVQAAASPMLEGTSPVA
jgi:hypothetical protein